MINWLKYKFQGRSPEWNKVRKQAIDYAPCCAACATKKNLEVHHIIPFAIRPDLELDRSNLIVFCKHCHFTIGHFNDYQSYNRYCSDDAMIFSMRIATNKRKIIT